MSVQTASEERSVTTMPLACADELQPRPESAMKPSWVLRFLPCFGDAAFLVPIVMLYLTLGGVSRMLGDGDTGWHLRTGEWILQNGQVPRTDMFSWTKAGQPWFAWEWLWDLIFGWVHLHWGMAAIVWLGTLIVGITFALLYRFAAARCGNPAIALAITLLGASCSSVHWLMRPHMMSWCFTLAFVCVLDRVERGSWRGLIWLPVLTVLWVNLHAGFIAGFLIVGACAAGRLIEWLVNSGRPEALAKAKWYGVALAACLAASFINPYGYKLHSHIIAYLGEDFHFENVMEFSSLSFHHPLAIIFEVLIVLSVVAAFREMRQGRFVYPLLILGWLHLALLSVRNIPLFIIVCAAPVSSMLASALRELSASELAGWLRRVASSIVELGRNTADIEALRRVPIAPVVGLVLVALLLRAAPSKEFRAEYDPSEYPAGALEYMRANHLLDKIYTNDEWGDYLIYRLYPELNKAFVDGRTDFYGQKFGEEYLQLFQGKWTWEGQLNAYGVRTVLLSADAPLATTMKESARWRLVYDDRVANVFERVRAGSSGSPLALNSQASAASGGGSFAIVKSQTINPVIHGSQSYARREQHVEDFFAR